MLLRLYNLFILFRRGDHHNENGKGKRNRFGLFDGSSLVVVEVVLGFSVVALGLTSPYWLANLTFCTGLQLHKKFHVQELASE